METCSRILKSMNRRKTLGVDMLVTKLKRCLGATDLIPMGIGYMVGTGIFVLTGEVARYKAGAATIISYILAGIAAVFSALCYAEFSSLVPLAGSAYTYTYVTVGEYWAFLVGWNMLLEYIIGTAATTKSWSGSLDALFNGSISNGIEEYIGSFDASWASPYPDFIAVLVIVIVSVFVGTGAKSSSNFNKVMVFFKLATISIIIVAGFMLANVENWTNKEYGGFAPFGIAGIFKGAATCFFAYVGFDGLAAASEETINPRKTIPLSIIVSMIIVIFLYVITSMVLTLMVPYYDVNPLSPYPSAFALRGESWAQYVVAVGTLFGLMTVILSGLFTLPRVLYSVANDGLLFKFLGYVHPKTQTPLVAIVLNAVLSSLLAFFFNLNVLVDLLSIGTLFSFTFVAGCIILLRYSENIIPEEINSKLAVDDDPSAEGKPIMQDKKIPKYNETENPVPILKESMNSKTLTFLNSYKKTKIVAWCLLIMGASMMVFILLLELSIDDIRSVTWWAVILLIISLVGSVAPLVTIWLLEPTPWYRTDTYRMPLVPLLPSLSIFANLGLMLMLDYLTWLRLLGMIALGTIIYFAYGIRHSVEGKNPLPYTELDDKSEEGGQDNSPKP